MSINNRAPQVTTSKLMDWLKTTYTVNSGETYPQNPSDGDFFYITSSPAHYAQWQEDISTWVDLGPSTGFSLGNLPTGTNPVQLKDTKSGGFVNLFVVYEQEEPAPLLVTDQGFIVKKDLAVGGNILSGQGAMIFGHGWTGSGSPSNPIAQSPPLIDLMNSSTSIKSGPSLPSANDMNGQPGQIFHNTSDNKLYIWTGQFGDPSNTWIYSETNPTGKYDTLFLVKGDGYSAAHLHLGDLIVEAGHSVAPAGDGTSSIGLSTKMFQNMYSNNLVIGNYTEHSTRYITLANTDSAGENSGLILNFNTSSAFGAIIPDYENPTPNKTMNLGDTTHKWTNIYCTNLTVNAISGTTNPLTIDTGLAINGNTRIAGYAQFNNDARLVWANDNTLEIQNDSGTPYSGNLNLNNIYVAGSIQPLGGQGYISVGTLMNFTAGIQFNGDAIVISTNENTISVQDNYGEVHNGVLNAGYLYCDYLCGMLDGTVRIASALSVYNGVGSAGQLLSSRGAGEIPQWVNAPTQDIQFGSGTTNVSGVATITFPHAFSSTPKITLGGYSEGVVLSITSKTTTGFSVKARGLWGCYTDEIGDHSHTVTASGTSGSESSHTHYVGSHTHDFNAGNHAHSFSDSATTGSGSSHTHSIGHLSSTAGQSAGTPSGSISSYGTHDHWVYGGNTVRTSYTGGYDGHTHQYEDYYPYSDTSDDGNHNHTFTGNAMSSHSHGIKLIFTSGSESSHTHSVSVSGTTGSSGVSGTTENASGNTGSGSSHNHNLSVSGTTNTRGDHSHVMVGNTPAINFDYIAMN